MDILYEDNHLIIINKPAGVLVQGDKTGDICLIDELKEYLKIKYNKPGNVYLGLPHRLDRPTSGIVLLAKTSKAIERLNEMFRQKQIKKTYLAVVEQKPFQNSAKLEHYLVKDERTNKSKAYSKGVKNSKYAALTYTLIGSSQRYFLLEIELHTGRHHQIRAQLSEIGCHIKGDIKYGAKRTNPDGSIHLHSYKIEFFHPVKKESISITAPTPDETVWNAFK